MIHAFLFVVSLICDIVILRYYFTEVSSHASLIFDILVCFWIARDVYVSFRRALKNYQ